MRWVSGRRVLVALFVLALVVQLFGLYWPRSPSGGGIPGLDKVTHVALFLAPALLGVLAGVRPVVLAPLLIAHAVLSEVVQHVALPSRSGDPWDAVADIVGVAAGLAIGSALLLRSRAARADRDPGGTASGDDERGRTG